MSEAFLPYLPIAAIRAAYAAGRGDELGSGKMESAESSAALVANTFGLFLDRAADLPPLKSIRQTIEQCGSTFARLCSVLARHASLT
jgi:hypothetical protein